MPSIQRSVARCRWWRGAVILLGLASACDHRPHRIRKVVTVFAASSLTEVFEAVEASFEQRHPDIDLHLAFAGSQVLRIQIQHGAPADVVVSANEEHVAALEAEGYVSERRPFASNELVVIVPSENPSHIEHFEDLDEASRIVTGADNVPVGIYTDQLFERARTTLGTAFVSAIRRRVVSRESNVRLVRAKVELGEADAAVVYRTDAMNVTHLRAVPIPADLNVQATYWLGTVARATDHPTAARLVDYLYSDEARRILHSHGFNTVLD